MNVPYGPGEPLFEAYLNYLRALDALRAVERQRFQRGQRVVISGHALPTAPRGTVMQLSEPPGEVVVRLDPGHDVPKSRQVAGKKDFGVFGYRDLLPIGPPPVSTF